jgi:hypothetical protein
VTGDQPSVPRLSTEPVPQQISKAAIVASEPSLTINSGVPTGDSQIVLLEVSNSCFLRLMLLLEEIENLRWGGG